MACECASGAVGVQLCGDDGSYGECSCGITDAGLDGGVDAMDVEDGERADARDVAVDVPIDVTLDVPIDAPPFDAGVTCYQPGRVLVAPGDTLALGQGLCTDQDLEDVDECYSNRTDACAAHFGFAPRSDPGAPFDVSAPLADCSACVMSVDPARPAAAVLMARNARYLNVWACHASRIGLPECAIPVSRRFYCAITACDTCAVEDAEPCMDAAHADVCARIAMPEVCEGMLDMDLDPRCVGEYYRETLQRIGSYFCGE